MRTPLLILFLFIAVSIEAQTPQHIVNYSFGGQTGVPLADLTAGKWQSLYLHTEFPTASSGFIKSIYLKSAKKITANQTYRHFLIKMGYMPERENGLDSNRMDTTAPLAFYATDTVFYAGSYSVMAPVDTGAWVKFTLQKPFYYNANKNFLVDIAQDSISVSASSGNVLFLQFAQPPVPFRTYVATSVPNYTSNWNNPSVTATVLAFGFDFVPSSINKVAKISNLSIHPNPSHGKFALDIAISKPVSILTISVKNIVGMTIKEYQYQRINNSFSTMIDLTGLSAGVYLASINADDEVVTRKVVVE